MSGSRLPWWGFPIFVAVLTACSDPAARTYFSKQSVDDAKKKTQTADIKIFPHPENFAAGSVHGSAVFPPGALQPCLLCHSREKASGPVKSCFDCHDSSFVHEASSFKNPEVHGPIAIQKGYRTTCIRCHGADLQGGKSGISCSRTECHSEATSFPHMATDMRRKETHGPLALRLGPGVCLACHGVGSSKTGKNSCYDCHNAAWVHTAAEFRDPAVHGAAAMGMKTRQKCATCHSLSGETGKSGPACSRKGCHATESGFPHVSAEWSDPAKHQHGDFVVKNGYDSCVRACHTVDPVENQKIKACRDCHEFPHKKEWKDHLITTAEKMVEAGFTTEHEDLYKKINPEPDTEKRVGCNKVACHVIHIQKVEGNAAHLKKQAVDASGPDAEIPDGCNGCHDEGTMDGWKKLVAPAPESEAGR
jgi:hypothetical protein